MATALIINEEQVAAFQKAILFSLAADQTLTSEERALLLDVLEVLEQSPRQ